MIAWPGSGMVRDVLRGLEPAPLPGCAGRRHRAADRHRCPESGRIRSASSHGHAAGHRHRDLRRRTRRRAGRPTRHHIIGGHTRSSSDHSLGMPSSARPVTSRPRNRARRSSRNWQPVLVAETLRGLKEEERIGVVGGRPLGRVQEEMRQRLGHLSAEASLARMHVHVLSTCTCARSSAFAIVDAGRGASGKRTCSSNATTGRPSRTTSPPDRCSTARQPASCANQVRCGRKLARNSPPVPRSETTTAIGTLPGQRVAS
jgi:hypothetical protein